MILLKHSLKLFLSKSLAGYLTLCNQFIIFRALFEDSIFLECDVASTGDDPDILRQHSALILKGQDVFLDIFTLRGEGITFS